MSPYRTPAPPPKTRRRLDRYQIAAIVGGSVFFVAFTLLVKIVGIAWRASMTP